MSSKIHSELVRIDELIKEPYVNVLCYPKPDVNTAIERINELKLLKVKSILFEGKTKIGKLGVVGKGCVSIVVKAITDFGIFALKIRRMDANRISMKREAEMHLMANSVNVGPKLFGVTENFLLMEFIEGYSILEWLKRIEEQSIERVRKVLKELLDQCYALDKLGLDHGELSDLKKHVIISEKPVIIDFESASISRRVANLTKIIQYLFIGGPMAKKLRQILSIEDEKIIINSIKDYKEEKDQENYLKLLSWLNLVS
ncbi:MAG: serine/threonine protein kinase [archaeon]|nr:serine/threonine protein kinase [archaeon]MCP8313453.1 serine/threonine protein kinase [archaeon]